MAAIVEWQLRTGVSIPLSSVPYSVERYCRVNVYRWDPRPCGAGETVGQHGETVVVTGWWPAEVEGAQPQKLGLNPEESDLTNKNWFKSDNHPKQRRAWCVLSKPSIHPHSQWSWKKSRKSQGKPICAASTISLHIPSFKYLVGAYGSAERPTLPSLPLNDGRLCLKKCPAQSRRSGSNPHQATIFGWLNIASSGTTLLNLWEVQIQGKTGSGWG